jgi:hypothetical protein
MGRLLRIGGLRWRGLGEFICLFVLVLFLFLSLLIVSPSRCCCIVGRRRTDEFYLGATMTTSRRTCPTTN